MASIWVESLGRSFEQALDLLAGAVRDCPGTLWEAPMWPEAAPPAEHPFLGADWQPITDPAERSALAEQWVRRRSTPWSVAWHALETLDYDLNGDFAPWMPPPPFAGHPHWRDLPRLASAWTRDEIGGYIEHCRAKLAEALASMRDEVAARPLPRTHRYGGQPHAWIITGMVGHTTEHASQIRQFITSVGIGPNG